MAEESRVRKSLQNARIDLICYFASLIVAFFTRKVFLDQLGTEFLGLTGTLNSLLGFLNMAELGIGSAIGYVLYKPLFEKNQGKINEIISVLGYLYQLIGFTILGGGVILSLFLPLIFPDTTLPYTVVYFGFYAYLAASMLGYFANYRQTLLSADQKNYVVVGWFQLVTTIKVIIQMVLALVVCSFYLYLALELLFAVVNSFILHRKVNTTYPWLRSDLRLGKMVLKKYPEIGKYVRQMFVHKIGGFVQFQLSPFFIYTYTTLSTVTLYGNYTLVTQRISSLLGAVLRSTWAGVGNLISEGNKGKIYSVYQELFALRVVLSGFFAVCIYQLMDAFISVWLGEEYVMSHSVLVLICVHLFISLYREVNDQFIFGFGLFYDTWSPVVESLLFVVFSMVLGSLFGLEGVLAGPILSTLIIHILTWKPWFLFRKGFSLPVWHYYFLLFSHIALLVMVIILSFLFFDQLSNLLPCKTTWLGWIIHSVLFSLLNAVISMILFFAVVPGFRRLILRFIKVKK